MSDAELAAFARKWFAAISGDDEHYDIPKLEKSDDKTHATLDAFVEDLCELIISVECAASEL